TRKHIEHEMNANCFLANQPTNKKLTNDSVWLDGLDLATSFSCWFGIRDNMRPNSAVFRPTVPKSIANASDIWSEKNHSAFGQFCSITAALSRKVVESHRHKK